MASEHIFSFQEVESDICRVLWCVEGCLSNLHSNNAKHIGFDENCKPLFVLSSEEDKDCYAVLLKSVDLLGELWYNHISKTIPLNISWYPQTVFDEAGRITGPSRLCFELKSKPSV